MLTRRSFLFSTAGALVAQASRRPNVVVFYIDDMGYGEPACYGGKLAPTPNIDRIAKNGVRFTDGYVSACVCGPSRVGLMTGRYQARTGHDANGNSRSNRGDLDLGEVTMAQYLKRAGYATAIVGKWHLGNSDARYMPPARGFDYAVGSLDNLGGEKAEYYRGSQRVDTLPGAPVTTPYYRDEALKWLDQNHSKPFFLYLPFNAVHAPHVATEKSMAKFAGVKEPRSRAYAAQVNDVDEAIGAVVDKVASLKQEEDTIFFVISDNGGAGPADVGELRGGKWDIFEGGIRVPFLMQWKRRVKAGQVLREPVMQIDVLPTVLDAAGGGVRPDKELDGVSLLPLVTGSGLKREALYWRFGVQAAVRQGKWKMVRMSEKSPVMLFDVVADAKESRDLSGVEKDRAAAMWGMWQKWNTLMKPPKWEDRRWYRGEESLEGGDRKKKERRKKKKG